MQPGPPHAVPWQQIPAGGYAVPPGAVPPGYPPGYPRPVYLQPPPLAPNGQPLADFFSRLGAYLLDGLIMGAIAAVFWVPLFIWWAITFFSQLDSVSVADDGTIDPSTVDVGQFVVSYLLLFAAIFVITLVVSFLYQVEFTWRTGQTIGKRVVKLKIVPVDPAAERTRGMLTKRWLVEHLGALVPFFSYLDGLWQLWDKPLQQCLHDKAAQTVVVKIG